MMILYALLLIVFVCINSYNVSEIEIEALEDLFHSTNGEQWDWLYPLSEYGKKWDFNSIPVDPCDNWQGISCLITDNNNTGTVSTVILNSYNLDGTLTPTLQNLRNVTTLDFFSNRLYGTIPSTFNNMTWLNTLKLSYNSISGSIPEMFFTIASNLSYLSLTENRIAQPLADISKGQHSTNLKELFLNGNYLSGTIPDSIDRFESLEVFFVAYNDLVGSIPEQVYHMRNVKRLALNNNGLTGTISNSLGDLKELRYAYMHENLLEHTIPASIGNLSYLLFMTLFENKLTGTLPSTFNQLTNLRSIAFDTNFLTGSIPSELGECSYLEELNLYVNMLTGTIPENFAQLQHLQLLLIDNNHLTGNPGSAFNRTAQSMLLSVDISMNKFEGTLPDAIFGKQLLSFSSFQTCFSGRIPKSICDSRHLESLVLDGITSQCSKKIWPWVPGSPRTAHEVLGSIPDCIWSLPNITTLHLSSNALSGTIPALQSYGNLTDLDLSFNLLSGSVPETLQSWPSLRNLNLQSNRFCGEITSTGKLNFAYHDGEFGTTLKLSENRFSGIIPIQIQAAINVDIVDGNMFSCSFKHYPPYNDPNGATYICGSNLLYVSMASLCAALGILAAALLAFYYTAFILVKKYKMQPGDHSMGCSSNASHRSSEENEREDTRAHQKNIFASAAASAAAVRQRMAVVYRTVGGALSLSEAVNANMNERYRYLKGLVVRMISWKRQIDALVATEDYRNSKVTQLGGVLKEALLSDQGIEEGGALHLLHGTDIKALKSANVPHLVQFFKSLRLLRNVAVFVFCVQLVITFPAYPILKYLYGTYMYQYGWYMSGAFVSGEIAAGVVILLWFVSLSIVLYAILRYVPSRKALNYRVAVQQRAYELLVLWKRLETNGKYQVDVSTVKDLAGSAVPVEIERESFNVMGMFTALSRASTINREANNGSIHNKNDNDNHGKNIYMDDKSFDKSPTSQADIQLVNTASFSYHLQHALSKPSINNDPARAISSSSAEGSSTSSMRTINELKKKDLYTYFSFFLRESVAVSIIAVLVNVIVVLSIKGIFVYALNSNKTSFGLKVLIELSLSCVDLIWSVMLVPFMITRLPKMKPAGKMILKIFLLYFNSILAPCLAIAMTENQCFYGLFVKHSSKTEMFKFSFCAFFDPYDPNSCIIRNNWETNVDYVPPFLYNYNCYSNVIAAYSPVFLFSYSILILLLPLASMYITTLTKRKWFVGVVPAIFWTSSEENDARRTPAIPIDQNNELKLFPSDSSVDPAHTSVTHPLHSTTQHNNYSNTDSNSAKFTASKEDKNQNHATSTSPTSLPSSAKAMHHVSSESSLVSIISKDEVDKADGPGSAAAGTEVKKRWISRIKLKTFLFFPGFILASAIHHILVLITFGLMLPVLGFAIVLVVVVTTTTWEMVIGRYLTMSTNCDPSRWHMKSLEEEAVTGRIMEEEGSNSRPNSGISTDSSASQQSFLTVGTASAVENDCSGGLDILCVHVACCARKCKWLIAYGSAVVFAFAVLDMVSDTEMVRVAIWAPILTLILPLLLLASLKLSRVGTTDQAAYEAMCDQQSTTETMILMRNTMGAEEFDVAGKSPYKARSSRFHRDESV